MDSSNLAADCVVLTLVLSTIAGVLGEIYLVRHKASSKEYVGQTMTHHLNHGKYRPFGYLQRWGSHISAAFSTKHKPHCRALSAAIRKYGPDAFEVIVLERCDLSQMDDLEIKYIADRKTLAPDGFNLTSGGRFPLRKVDWSDDEEEAEQEIHPDDENKRRTVQLESTKGKISTQLQKFFDTDEGADLKKARSATVKQQHADNKLKRFAKCRVDKSKPEQYCTAKFKDNGDFSHYNVRIDGKRTQFYAKYNSQEDVKKEVFDFIQNIAQN